MATFLACLVVSQTWWLCHAILHLGFAKTSYVQGMQTFSSRLYSINMLVNIKVWHSYCWLGMVHFGEYE